MHDIQVDGIKEISKRQSKINSLELKELKADLLWPTQRMKSFDDCYDYQKDLFVRSLSRDIDLGTTISRSIEELERAHAISSTQRKLEKLGRRKDALFDSIQTIESNMAKTLNATDQEPTRNLIKDQNNKKRRELK